MKIQKLLIFSAGADARKPMADETLLSSYICLCCAQEEEFFEQLRGGTFAAAVLDAPPEREQDVFYKLREESDVPVVFLTAAGVPGIQVKDGLGLYAVLRYPYSSKKLVRRLQELINLAQDLKAGRDRCCEFHTLLNSMEATVLELNFTTGRHLVLYNPNRAFESLEDSTDFKREFERFLEEKVHEEERPALIKRLKGCLGAWNDEDLPRDSVEYRVWDPFTQAYHWFSSTFLYVNTSVTQRRILIVIKDIDQMKRETALLESRARTDLLTGLSNKMTAQSQIEQYLKCGGQSQRHAMMIVDIDNFKQVNDRLGHMLGDAVLRDISSRLKKMFRCGDILGRIGGDEFIVFQKNIPDHHAAEKRAAELVQVFRKAIVRTGKDYEISASMGISLFPKDGESFEELFLKADVALYQAKKAGKNQWMLFSPDAAPEAAPGQMPSVPDASPGQPSLLDTFGNFVLRQFSENQNRADAVQKVLDSVSRNFHLDSAYLLEYGKGVACASGCKGVQFECPEFTLDSKEHPSYLDACDENGMFYCSNIQLLPLSLQKFFTARGLKSVLQFPVKVHGQLFGLLGFANHEKEWFWSQAEVDVCQYLAHAIGVYYS